MLIDATVIRCVLLPATMTVLGERNWYLPRWLNWLPQVGPEPPAGRKQDLALQPALRMADNRRS